MYHHLEPFQVGRLSGPMRRELSQPHPDVFKALEIDLPSGTRYYASGGLPKDAAHYKAKVTQGGWGTLNEGFDARASALGVMEWEVELADTDRDLATEKARNTDRIKGSVVRQYLGSRNVNQPDWLKFTGVVRDLPQMVRTHVWRVRVGAQDDALQYGYLPEGAVTNAVFPNAHQSALGQFPAVAYGVHSSQGFTAQGFAPTLYVDTVGFVYLVVLGKNTVPRVFKDGAQQSSGFSITYPVYGGRLYTAVKFTTDQLNATITVDLEGLTDRPDGTGTLIANRADQLKHALANLVFNQWQGQGSYYSAGPLVDHRLFASAVDFFRDHGSGYDGSKWIGGSSKTTALDYVNAWATAVEMKPFWTIEGKIGVRPLDYRAPIDPYSEEQWIKLGKQDAGAFADLTDSSGVFSKIALESTFGQVPGRFFGEALVTDLSAAAQATDSRQDPWSKAAVG